MQFDIVASNPPFQDTTNRKKTQHKLWIDFTRQTFDRWLKPGGTLLQVSPSSFLSPSSKILKILQQKSVKFLHLDTKTYFPRVGSTFADYMIVNAADMEKTEVVTEDSIFHQVIDSSVFYLPNDLCERSLSIHRKVMFTQTEHLKVEYDYVTCHNVLIHRNDTISKEQTDAHIYPILHTNSQTWYSQIRQDWADRCKVMWSRSGYTKPFYDDGKLGGTDMAYYITVPDKIAGENLAHNLNTLLMRYILKTAKWSGFGNEKVFCNLPNLPINRKLSDDDICDLFNLTQSEITYVRTIMG